MTDVADRRTRTRPEGHRRSRARLRVFGVLWIIILLNYIDRAALSISLPSITAEFGLSPELQGWVLGSFFWTYLIFQVPGGWLLDRFGPRRVVAVAGSIWGAFQILGGAATGGTFLGASRLGLGAAEAPCAPSAAKLNSSWLPAEERARGATFVDMAGPFGTAVGGVLVTTMIGLFGSWRWAFVATGVLTMIAALAYYRYVRDTPEEHDGVDAAELEHIRVGADAPGSPAAEPALPKVVDYLRSTSFWGLMFGRLGWAVVWWGLISWTPTYLSTSMGFDLKGLGWSTFVIYGMGVVGQLLAGQLADRGRERTGRYNIVMKGLLAVSGVGTVICVFSLLGIENGYVALVALSLAVFFINFGGLYWAIPAWLAPRSQVGTVGGVMNIASSGGGALAPVVMGYMIGAAGGSFAGAFTFLGIASGLYLVGSMVINFTRPLAVASPR